MRMEEIKKQIGKMTILVQDLNAKHDQALDFITRLKEHTVKKDTLENYEERTKRDEFLLDEIKAFYRGLGVKED